MKKLPFTLEMYKGMLEMKLNRPVTPAGVQGGARTVVDSLLQMSNASNVAKV